MSQIVEVFLSDAGPAGLGGGIVPFGIYKIVVDKQETKPVAKGKNKGLQGTTVWGAIETGTDPEQKERQIRPYIVWPDSTVEPGNKRNVLTAKVKRFLTACAGTDSEMVAKVKGKTGALKIDLSKKLEKGTVHYVLHDPATPNTDENDEYAFLTKEEYEKALAGELRFTRKNTYGLSDEEAAKLGVRRPGTNGGGGTRAAAAGAGGAVPDTNWQPPGQGAPDEPVAAGADAEDPAEEMM